MNYTTRDTCIFCDYHLSTPYFSQDHTAPVAHYPVEADTALGTMAVIPYNIFKCPNCKTVQTKYLGNLNEVYKTNHADSTGTTMTNLHKLNLEFILKYKDSIKNIIEIGSSKGVLADDILSNLDTKYFIIEPSYIGDRRDKTIIENFYENVDDTRIDANTLIISHVLEHFYEPKKIIEKITNNTNITNFFLVFPDLEYYINHNILHVLNSEHTFYIDNNFLIKLMKAHGFSLIEQLPYAGHSVLFYFQRKKQISTPVEINFFNIKHDVEAFFTKIKNTATFFNNIATSKKKVYIWPASAHSLCLLGFGLEEKNLTGMLDNSPLKIGKKMYGTDLLISDFNDKIEGDSVVLLNGGPFNSEVEEKLKQNKTEYYTHPAI